MTDVKGMRDQAEDGVGGLDAGLPFIVFGILHSSLGAKHIHEDDHRASWAPTAPSGREPVTPRRAALCDTLRR